MSTPRDRVLAHLDAHAVRRGDFVLKSGKRTNWFLDVKQTLCDPAVMIDAAHLVLALVPTEATALGGLTMGADPVAYVAAAVGTASGRPLRCFSVRKEEKDHGAGGRIAGALGPGDVAVITEDAVTRGTSLLEAAAAVASTGARVLGLVAFVDRGGTVTEMARAAGYPFWSVFTALDLGFPLEGG